jgi:hypothetical protein
MLVGSANLTGASHLLSDAEAHAQAPALLGTVMMCSLIDFCCGPCLHLSFAPAGMGKGPWALVCQDEGNAVLLDSTGMQTW